MPSEKLMSQPQYEEHCAPLPRSSHPSDKFVPHPIPNLPMMDELGKRGKNFIAQSKVDPKKTAFVFRQHILETTLNLIEQLIKSGVPPENIYLTGKDYSTNPNVLAQMGALGIHVWPGNKSNKLGDYQSASDKDIDNLFESVEENPSIENVVICDDGGKIFERMPPHFRKKYRIAGAEQTRGAFYSDNVNMARIPIVNVAQSALKTEFESPFIADAIKNTIVSISGKLNKEKTIIGIVGFGNVGKQVADIFIEAGFNIMVYDKNPEAYKNYTNIDKIEQVNSIEELFIHTNFIMGCTGQDITANFSPLSLNGHDRKMASATSEDREFRTFLKEIASKSRILEIDPLSNIRCYTDSGNKIEILYGGFPVNFAESNKKAWNVPAEDIALTQGALFVAIMQSLFLLGKKQEGNNVPTNVMLDPALQQVVLNLWFKTTKKGERLSTAHVERFVKEREWVIKNSKGDEYPCDFIKFFSEPSLPKPYVIKSKL